jgi:hypothetical protein
MRISVVASLLLLTATVPAAAQLTIGISIGAYPNFMVMPGYAVYYAPDVGANYFFYDGFYWVYQDDTWYSSSWYNGPWESVGPMYVPIEVLQIPVRYYRRPPQYFIGWQSDRPPRWNDHWGHDWAERRHDWDRPRQNAHPAPAPLPDYQRRYSGKDYPRAEQQQTLQQQNYRYHPQNSGQNSGQNAGASRDSGKQTDERGPGPAQPTIQQQPTRESSNDRQGQSRPAPQQAQPKQQDRPNQQAQPKQQDRPNQQEQPKQPAPQKQQEQPRQQEQRAPQQDQHQPATGRPEQPRAPATREPDNAGA